MYKHSLAILLIAYSINALAIDETAVEIIPLAAPLNQDKAELSGLSWCGDKLILLPQYPERFSDDGNSYFYYLERQQITDYLDRVSTKALKAKPIKVNEKTLRKAVSIFDGFEAIACDGSDIWLSIEAVTYLGKYQSFVVPATISFDDQVKIEIDQQKLVFLSSQSKMRNMGDEAIIMAGNDVIAVHEVNDQKLVATPKAKQVSKTNQSITELDFPHIPYRITDATKLDHNNRFWAINYKYSGDKFSRDSHDAITEKHGEGESHKQYYNVERLIEFSIENNNIKLAESAPIPLKMNHVEGRNWEGLVRLENKGFLLVTDKHPSTLLGFVRHAEQE